MTVFGQISLTFTIDEILKYSMSFLRCYNNLVKLNASFSELSQLKIQLLLYFNYHSSSFM